MREADDMPRTLVVMALWQGADLNLQEWVREGQEGLGMWGGKLKINEAPLEGVLRETKQETGLKLVADQVSELGHFRDDGWDIYAYQASLDIDATLPNPEGRPVIMHPLDAWNDGRLMPATRMVIKETIMIPNGLIDY